MVVKIVQKCPECGGKACVDVGVVDRGDCLSWYRQWICNECSYNVQEDGDDIPSYIRNQIVGAEGGWGVYIGESSRGLVGLKVVKDIFGLELRDVLKLKQNSDGLVFRGTEVEASFYRRKCLEKGLDVTLSRLLSRADRSDNSG